MNKKELLTAFIKYDADKNADWRIPIEENTVNEFLQSIESEENNYNTIYPCNNFIKSKKYTSATICENCGCEKLEHNINFL